MSASAVREDEALTLLKAKLRVPPATKNAAVDGYLLRYLRCKNLNVNEAATKLGRRRYFEKTFPSISVSAHVVTSLRSGAFAVIGTDVLHRPVIYLRVSQHRPSSDHDADEKLVICVMEYLQSLVVAGNGGEVVALLNEEGTGWFTDNQLGLQERLATLIDKYYSNLFGLLLVVNATWSVAKGMKLSLSAAKSSSKNAVVIVSRAELLRYIDAAVLPVELGGHNNVAASCPGQDFCDSVLRYWYVMTSAITASSDITANVWQPLPLLVQDWQVPPRAPEARRALARRMGPATEGSRRSRAGMASCEPTDDGRCSVISDEGTFCTANDDASTAPRNTATKEPSPVSGTEDVKELRARLEVETRRRFELEHQLARLQLGIPASDEALTRLESALRVAHDEVNILVGEVLHKVKTTLPPGVEPKLSQLIEATDRALMHVTHEKHVPPAMRFAVPVQREASRCVVS